MAPVNLPMLRSVFDLMIENELALSEFYSACAGCSQEDAPFWCELAETERRHAETISRISEVVQGRPGRFESGRPFNASALKTVISYVKRNTSDLKEGKLPYPKPLFLALDMEKSVLETRYFEIVKSKDVEFQDLSSRILNDTFGHRNALQKKIEKFK